MNGALKWNPGPTGLLLIKLPYLVTPAASFCWTVKKQPMPTDKMRMATINSNTQWPYRKIRVGIEDPAGTMSLGLIMESASRGAVGFVS